MRRSPFFQGSPPPASMFGTYGSFGMMDTPSGVLGAEFSPMGPAFSGFGDEPTPLGLLAGVGDDEDEDDTRHFTGKLSLSRSGSSVESDTQPLVQRRSTTTATARHHHHRQLPMSSNRSRNSRSIKQEDGGAATTSPMRGFLNDLGSGSSPMMESGIQGVPRSPLRREHIMSNYATGSTSHENQAPNSRERSHRPTSLQGAAVTMSASRGNHNSSRILGSPMESTAKPRKLFLSGEVGSSSLSSAAAASATVGTPAVRVELGKGFISTRSSLEGINSMMKARSGAPPPARDATPSASRGATYESRHAQQPLPLPQYSHPAVGYRGTMTTPIKSMGHSQQQQQQNPTPQSGHRMPPHHSAYHHPGSGSKQGYHPSSMENSGYPTHPSSAQKHPYHLPGSGQKHHLAHPGSAIAAPLQITPSSGKENKKKSSKRSACNCKKSKCLKLYCECFASEKFCNDCNCNDCGNTSLGGEPRAKAIKDTRAKNPNAFKVRVGVKVLTGSPETGHNMGCRCKRSECLKKYCEVRA
jgi:hypothetical protein